jgi:hypothetical protein
VFSELLFSRLETDYFQNPFGFSNAITVWGTESGALRQFRLILPVGHPDNPTNVPVAAAYSFADIGRRRIQADERHVPCPARPAGLLRGAGTTRRHFSG